jgi:hypothetical protein
MSFLARRITGTAVGHGTTDHVMRISLTNYINTPWKIPALRSGRSWPWSSLQHLAFMGRMAMCVLLHPPPPLPLLTGPEALVPTPRAGVGDQWLPRWGLGL